MDKYVVDFYRRIYADLKIDSEEADELKEFLSKLNPPPDKILWMRATAFRIASEFLSSDNREANLSLLKTLNCMVHAIETNCLEPKDEDADNGGSPMDSDVVSEFYRGVLQQDWTVDRDDASHQALKDFFTSNVPDAASLAKVRFLAFKVASEFLVDDDDTSDQQEERRKNENLLRGINAVVHAFEVTCLKPKPLQLKVEEKTPPGVDVSRMTISEAVQHLWTLDDNRLDPSRDYTMHVQGGKKPFWKEDKAEDPLFSYVNPQILQQRPTYKAFIALLDNYTPHTGQTEVVTRAEQDEINAFLQAIMQTKPMQFCHHYCCNKQSSSTQIPSDTTGFVRLLHEIWFDLYRREASNDSSGFEHVFVGEIRDHKISGFHNWIQFYLQEQKGTVDYRGYIKPRSQNDALSEDDDHLLTLQFTWHGVEKMVGSSFIGVSPEFELALYTMCFLVGEQVNSVQLSTSSSGVKDVYDLDIVCHKMAQDKIGTSYPEIKSHYEE
ncbi:hypothetical protein ACA910_014458 [Epithemia clementina (nom. ined.)]